MYKLRNFPEQEAPWSELAVAYTASDAESGHIFPYADVRFLKGSDDDDAYSRFFFVYSLAASCLDREPLIIHNLVIVQFRKFVRGLRLP